MWAIVGRPNVGKSTLFNRLVGTRAAITAAERGTTRDRLYGRFEWRGAPLTLIDTGGFEQAPSGTLAAAVQAQVRRALQDADGLVFVCDARDGLLPADHWIADTLRRADRPVVLAVNKTDSAPRIPADFFTLGFDPLPVSALHGRGIGELLDRLVARAAPAAAAPEEPPGIRVALVGRQNVGKSSLLNALLREERAIVHDQPGTTRDTIDAAVRAQGEALTVTDTAGLRHRRKVRDLVDVFAMARTLGAIERCDVAVLVLDAAQGVTRDDKRIARRIADTGRALAVALNKWDLVSGAAPRAAMDGVRRALPPAAHAPVVAVSAKTGLRVPELLTTVLRLVRLMERGLPAEACASLVHAAWRAQPPSRVRGRLPMLRSVAWRRGRPPVLELSVQPAGLPPGYQRYLVNALARDPRLAGMPLRLQVRAPAPRRRR